MSQGWGNQGNKGWPQQTGQQQQGWGQPPQQQGWGQPQQQGWGQQGGGLGGGSWGNQQQPQTQGFSQPSLFQKDRYYMISTALDDKKFLDVSQANDNTKSSLLIWQKNGGANQKFRLDQVQGNKYSITSAQGQSVEVPNNSSANGTQITAGPKNNSANEYWQIYPSQKVKGAYIFKAFNGLVLDVCQGKKKHGTPVIQWTFNGDANQSWFIHPV